MKFEIIHEVSETEREIYEFAVKSYGIIYTGIWISRRNDKDDIWGDLWNEFYDKVMNAELDIDLGEDAERYQEILDKYNPIVQKTDSGKSYLQGEFEGKNLPTPKISKEQIKEEIMTQFSEVMNDAEITF